MLLGLRELIFVLMYGSSSPVKVLSQMFLTATALLFGLGGAQCFGGCKRGSGFLVAAEGGSFPSHCSLEMPVSGVFLCHILSLPSSYLAGFLSSVLRGNESFILIMGGRKAELMELRKSDCCFPAARGKK